MTPMLDARRTRYGVHLTQASNLESIGKHGLVPCIGASSKLAEETTPRIYMYGDLMTVDDDLARQTGDLLAQTQQMAALLVDLTDMRATKSGHILTVDRKVPTTRLELLTPNLVCAKDITASLRTFTARRDLVIRRLGIPPESWGLLNLEARWEALGRGSRIHTTMLQRGLPGLEEERLYPRNRA